MIILDLLCSLLLFSGATPLTLAQPPESQDGGVSSTIAPHITIPVIDNSVPAGLQTRESPTRTPIRLTGRPGWNPAWGIGPVIPPSGFFFDLKVTSPALATPWPKLTPTPTRSSLQTESDDRDAVDQSALAALPESDASKRDKDGLDWPIK